jgi:type I site-specific restriction endonuclease
MALRPPISQHPGIQHETHYRDRHRPSLALLGRRGASSLRDRHLLRKYREPDAWKEIDDEKREELIKEVAPLPSDQRLGTEEAKRFDLLMFSLELALLKDSKRFDKPKKHLMEIASALEA